MNPTVPVNGTVPMDPVVQVTPSAVPPELYYRYSNDTHDAAGRWEDSISQGHKTHPTPLFSNRHLIWVSPHFIFCYRQLLGGQHFTTAQNPSDTSVQQPASNLGIATLYLLVPTVAGSLLKTKTNK